MSSGVSSDKMKVPANRGKSVEERNIPWSQQVDEASYENLASSVEENVTNQSSMQFQYPPFNAKENQGFGWSNYKSRKQSNVHDTNKKYGKPFYNNSKRDDFQYNLWNTQNSKRVTPDSSGHLKKLTGTDEFNSVGSIETRPIVSTAIEEKKTAPPSTSAPKKTTWASIASQPAKLTCRTPLTATSHKKKGPGMPPPPMVPGKHNLDVNAWDIPNNNPPPVPSPPPFIDLETTVINPDFPTRAANDRDGITPSEKSQKAVELTNDDTKLNYNSSNFGRVRNSPNGHSRKNWSSQHPLHQNRQMSGNTMGLQKRGESSNISRINERRIVYGGSRSDHENTRIEFGDENKLRNNNKNSSVIEVNADTSQAVLDELRDKNNYNPAEIDLEKAAISRFFVIKSYSEDDIHRSIKYEIWCSTDHGNKRLDEAFKERHKESGHILLFFSVNGSGHFCGMAQMMTAVDYNSTSSVWSQDKWKGKFKVKWIYVKDVPNSMLRHIRLENNDNKSVTNSRDTQEVPNAQGIEVLRILHSYEHLSSIFDDFYHYEKKQEEEVSSKKPFGHDVGVYRAQSPGGRHLNRHDDRDRDRPGTQKFFTTNSSGSNFRDRNNTHRANFNSNLSDFRRFDNHRTSNNIEYQQKDRDGDVDREMLNSEYGNRHSQKLDYVRREDRTQSKHNNRERDFSDDYSKTERFRIQQGDTQKDNEYSTTERTRSNDY